MVEYVTLFSFRAEKRNVMSTYLGKKQDLVGLHANQGRVPGQRGRVEHPSHITVHPHMPHIQQKAPGRYLMMTFDVIRGFEI